MIALWVLISTFFGEAYGVTFADTAQKILERSPVFSFRVTSLGPERKDGPQSGDVRHRTLRAKLLRVHRGQVQEKAGEQFEAAIEVYVGPPPKAMPASAQAPFALQVPKSDEVWTVFCNADGVLRVSELLSGPAPRCKQVVLGEETARDVEWVLSAPKADFLNPAFRRVNPSPLLARIIAERALTEGKSGPSEEFFRWMESADLSELARNHVLSLTYEYWAHDDRNGAPEKQRIRTTLAFFRTLHLLFQKDPKGDLGRNLARGLIPALLHRFSTLSAKKVFAPEEVKQAIQAVEHWLSGTDREALLRWLGSESGAVFSRD